MELSAKSENTSVSSNNLSTSGSLTKTDPEMLQQSTPKQSTPKQSTPKHLVLSGGGVRGSFYIGFMKYVEQSKCMDFSALESIAGTSIGAFVGVGIALGYRSDELAPFLYRILNYKDNHSFRPLHFFRHFGLDTGERMEYWIKQMIFSRTGDKCYTFRKLLRERGIELHIFTTCLEDRGVVQLSTKTHPNMKLWKALRMTMTVPFLFRPFEYRGKHYLDGALKHNFPIHIHSTRTKEEKESVLGLHLGGNQSPLSRGYHFTTYLQSIIDIIIKNSHPVDDIRVFYFNTSPPGLPIGSLRHKLSQEEYQKCIEYGSTLSEECFIPL